MSGDTFDDFEWDDDKNKSNLEKHGMDFEFASRVFDGDYLEWTLPMQDIESLAILSLVKSMSK